MRAAVIAIEEAGKGSLRLAGATIPSSETTLQRLRFHIN
jgi:hypothetical protein